MADNGRMPSDVHEQAAAAELAAEAVDPVGATEGTATPGLGAAVGRGVAWSVLATIIGKSLSFVSQIVLGWYLSKGDFGVYAIAMSGASFAFAFRDGGLWNLLIARGSREYEALAGPIHWMGMTFSLAVAGLMAASAPVFAWAYGDPRLVWLILIIAVAWPLSAPSWVMRARLVIDLRFRDATTLSTVTSFVRYGSMIAFAIGGMGPLSFVLPLIAAAVSDNVMAYWLTRDHPWKRPVRLDLWRPLLAQSVWCIVGTVANAVLEMGIYLVMGALLSQGEVGLYYFAYQLVAQTGALLAANVQNVLFPAMSRIQDEPARRREAALRSLRALTLISAPASIGLAVVFGPAESLVWNGRWIEAYWPVLILGAAYPMRAVFAVPQVIEMSRGGFKQSAFMTLWTGTGLMAVSGAAAAMWPSATVVALAVGVYLVFACLACCWWSLRRLGASGASVMGATLPAWLLGLAGGMLGVWVERRLNLAQVATIPRGVAAGLVFGGVYTLGVRGLLERDLRDLLRALPMGLGGPVGRMLHMRVT